MRIDQLRRRAAAFGGALAALCACHPAPQPSSSTAWAISHATVIDPDTGPHQDLTIVVAGGRIVEVGPSATVAIPAGAVVRDASGQFVMPGLWDAHVHISQIGEASIPLLVGNGVTTVRDMGSDLKDVAAWRKRRQDGGAVPRVFSPGPKLDGGGDGGPDSLVVASPEAARAAVDRLRGLGVDFIKVHNGLSRASYDAVADECRVRGLAFVGHASGEFPPLVAIAAGQRTLEHGRGMLPCTPDQRAQLRAGPELAPLAQMCASEDTADQIVPAMAAAGTWFTPTLVSWRGQALDRDAVLALDGIADAPAVLQQRWGPLDELQPVTALERELLAAYGPLAGRAAHAGVRLLAGTDSGDPFVVPGFALHDELRLLVAAGVPPLQAIRSATMEPARALGVADAMGSIAPGKAADLVLLAADPLADIRNTRRITAVVLDGHWLPAEPSRGRRP